MNISTKFRFTRILTFTFSLSTCVAFAQTNDLKQPDVKKTYYPNGKLQEQAIYNSDGQKNGLDEKHNDQGITVETTMYVNGKKNGLSKLFFDDGKVKLEQHFTDDRLNGIQKTYNENGNETSEYSYIDDKRNGEGKTFYDDGTMKTDEIYDNGNMTSQTKYDKKGKEIKK